MLRHLLLASLLLCGCHARSTSPTTRPAGPLVPPKPQLTVDAVIDIVSTGDPPDQHRLGISKGPRKRLYFSYSPEYPEAFYRLATVRHYGNYDPHPADAAKLLAVINDPANDIAARLCAAHFLLQLNNEPARSFISACLESKDRPALHNAAIAVCLHLDRDAVDDWSIEAMMKVLRDDRLLEPYAEQYRQGRPTGRDNDTYFPSDTFGQVCTALGRRRSGKAATVLIDVVERLPHQDQAVWALGQIGDPAAVPAILAQLVDEHGQLRGLDHQLTAIEALGEIGDPRAIDAIESYLADPQAEYKSVARLALVKLEAPDRGRAILRLLEKEIDGRQSLIEALGRLKERRAVPLLLRIAQDAGEDAHTRVASIHALGRIGGDEAVRALVSLFDTDFSVLKGPVKFNFNRCYIWIGESLERATAERFGTDARAWHDWLASRERKR